MTKEEKIKHLKKKVSRFVGVPYVVFMTATLFLFIAGWFWFESGTVLKYGFTCLFVWIMTGLIHHEVFKTIREKEKELENES
ncbi:MAG: hypothetical protein ABJG33_00105 [Balneola sp.]